MAQARVLILTTLPWTALLLAAACGSDSPAPSGSAGSAPNGGSTAQAGSAGATSAGGTTTSGGASGTNAVGGGGTTTSGGSPNGGALNGGASGSAGAGTSGAGGNGGGKGCASGAYLVCEDFESTEAGQVPTGWTRRGAADKVGVATDQAASGSKSLKLGPTENGERRIARPGADLGTAHWGRIRFKVQMPVTDAFVHSTLVAGSGMGPTKGEVEVRLVDTVKASKQDTPGWCSDKQVTTNCYQLLYNVQPKSAAEFGKGGPYGWSFDDQWHCAEWHVDSTDQSYELFYDGKRVDDVSFKNGAGNFDNAEIPSVWSELRVGWNNYQSATNPGFTAWIDDVVLDDARVGCEP
jgi:hypothetical protein